MSGYPNKIFLIHYVMRNWHQLFFTITLFGMISLLTACAPKETTRDYKNPENGVHLQKPDNWNVTFTERNGIVTLEAETGIWDKNSARIEIFAGGCPSNGEATSRESSYEILEDNIHRIGTLYGLSSVTIVQEPTSIETKHKDYEVAKAVIMIPTTSMLDDLPRIQVGKPDPEKFQTIDIFVIANNRNTTTAFVYKGNSNELNSEAHEIIDSI